MGQQWGQGRNQKVLGNKWKWHNDQKPIGHSESSPEREVYSIIDLPKEERKILKKQPNPTSKRTTKTTTTTTNKAQSEKKEGNNQDQSKNK